MTSKTQPKKPHLTRHQQEAKRNSPIKPVKPIITDLFHEKVRSIELRLLYQMKYLFPSCLFISQNIDVFILFIFFFSLGIRGCTYYQRCYWDYNNYVCVKECSDYQYSTAGSILSLVLCILNLSLFIITLIATINLGRGGCTPSQKGLVYNIFV